MISMTQAFKNFWKNYVKFMGTATRAEYWWMALWAAITTVIWIIITTILAVIAVSSGSKDINDTNTFFEFIGQFPVTLIIWGLISLIFWLSILIPSWSLSIRRYRDTGLNEILVWIIFAVGLGTSFYSHGNSYETFIAPGLVSLVQLVITLLPSGTLTDIKFIGRNK
ncbi:DUF805 domain-containing protein [Convivina praedatoris]|uniref:DUF805 domain-containing protein n=1 Tax=Convivina praedatoris TaxID=2880963 RepID=A0ABN8HDS4_9LACO|nr:DUF805 domain-containing protein [Convivina sp. LMG 32447]CAH1853755.1 hypothetical protein R077815_00919 [Convivina sp. LMG 32447]CAH1854651.1 hypothetical protein R078138_00947 [Convivina sp. LMG 32447]CAH1855214.1 hypothetical protein LMG032447_01033 [Convivina sp. LMG 32447]